MIRQYKIGSTVELSVLRGKTPQKMKVTLETSPRLPREMKKYEDPNFEFRVRDIAAADRLEEGLPRDQRGVLVDAVREGGWAALAISPSATCCWRSTVMTVADVEAVQAKMTPIATRKPRVGGVPREARHPHVLRRAAGQLEELTRRRSGVRRFQCRRR